MVNDFLSVHIIFVCLAFCQVEAPLDPMKELGRLISERKFDEAFTVALQRSDVSIVSWLCSQVSYSPFY